MERSSKEFKKLQDKWYKKLEKEKFPEIEQHDGKLKEWDSNFFRNNFDATRYEATRDYYRLAGQFLNDYKFENKRDKYIWELHSQGIPREEILEKLKSKGFKSYADLYTNTIAKLVKEMILKCR